MNSRQNRRITTYAFIYIVAGLVFGGCQGPGKQFRSSNLPEVSVSVTFTDSSKVEVELTNNSKERLSLRRESIPWLWRYAIVFIGIMTDAPGTVLDQVYEISEAPKGFVEFAPGEVKRQIIDLEARFPDIKEVLAKREVVLFWTLEIVKADGMVIPRQGGWLKLSK
jgi:hypothetical protein